MVKGGKSLWSMPGERKLHLYGIRPVETLLATPQRPSRMPAQAAGFDLGWRCAFSAAISVVLSLLLLDAEEKHLTTANGKDRLGTGRYRRHKDCALAPEGFPRPYGRTSTRFYLRAISEFSAISRPPSTKSSLTSRADS